MVKAYSQLEFCVSIISALINNHKYTSTLKPKLLKYKHSQHSQNGSASSSWYTPSSKHQPKLCFPEAHVCSSESKQVTNMFGVNKLLGNTDSIFDLKQLDLVTAKLLSVTLLKKISTMGLTLSFLCTVQWQTLTAVSRDPLMCLHFFFFCTSCSSFRAAVFFGSTLSRLFRSSTQALTSCRNDNGNFKLKEV